MTTLDQAVLTIRSSPYKKDDGYHIPNVLNIIHSCGWEDNKFIQKESPNLPDVVYTNVFVAAAELTNYICVAEKANELLELFK